MESSEKRVCKMQRRSEEREREKVEKCAVVIVVERGEKEMTWEVCGGVAENKNYSGVNVL